MPCISASETENIILILACVRDYPGAGIFLPFYLLLCEGIVKMGLCFLMGMEKFGAEQKCVIFVTHCNSL